VECEILVLGVDDATSKKFKMEKNRGLCTYLANVNANLLA